MHESRREAGNILRLVLEPPTEENLRKLKGLLGQFTTQYKLFDRGFVYQGTDLVSVVDQKLHSLL